MCCGISVINAYIVKKMMSACVVLRCELVVWILLNLSNAILCDVRCLDNNGKPVDWFVVMKLPRLRTSSYETVRKGVGQLYMDVNNQQWTFLEPGIDDSGNHAVYNTLQQIYSKHKSQDLAYVMYNDETPSNLSPNSFGHTKGDLCFDNHTGFWLVHSVPLFPPHVNDGYAYPATGHTYGQTLLCVTYGYDQLNVIGLQLLYNYPQIYDFNMPTKFHHDNDNLLQVINHKHVETSPWYHLAALTSESGHQFLSFAKFSKFGQDLYDSWLSPYLQSDLKVETWLNGVGRLPSNCSGTFKVWNVAAANFSSESFVNSHDHSKWAVTDSKDWICIGDINREKSQMHRAGGTVCSRLPFVAKAFLSVISKIENCNN